MTDTDLEAWLAERKRIHAAATKGVWEVGEVINWGDENDVPQVPVLSNNRAITWDDHGGEVFKPEDGTAIVDAHNVTVPALVAMVEAVLGQHRPVEVEPSDTICGGCSNRLPNGRYMPIVEFPCPTVRALEAVIGDE